METFGAASHHDVLKLLIQVAVLLFAARTMGEIAQRLRQPTVVGEILAGVILGPSLLGGSVPFIRNWIVPQTEVQGYLLETVSLFGVMTLLLRTGTETDLGLIRQRMKSVLGSEFGGLTFMLTGGFTLGLYLPDFLLVDAEQRMVFALFIATALSISAIPVLAKVLMDLNLIRRDIGQTIVAAGMVDDTVGWILLSIVLGLAKGGELTAGAVFSSVGAVLGVMAFSFTVGRRAVKKAFDFVQDEAFGTDRILSLALIFMFVWGAMTQALGLEPILGAFLLGILLGRMPRIPQSVHEKIESLSLGVFAPIFFAVAGLKVNARHLFEPKLLLITGIVIATASVGKVLGSYVGARTLGRLDHWQALSLGTALNARGAMEIIVATLGLQLEILSRDMFSIIVLMAVVTSLMAPPALRWVVQRVEPSEEERKRLEWEEHAKQSLIAGIRRVLLPVRYRETPDPNWDISARILESLGARNGISLTLLAAAPPGEKTRYAEFLGGIASLFKAEEIVQKAVEGSRTDDLILEEAQKNYHLMILGASQSASYSHVMFAPLTDHLVRASPCPTLVVQGRGAHFGWAPRRILVPVDGTERGRRAAELAFTIASSGEEDVVVLHIVERRAGRLIFPARDEETMRRLGIAHQIVAELAQFGASQNVRTHPEVRISTDPQMEITAYAAQQRVDLIVLGANVRPGSDQLFLGSKVDYVLNHSPCPVVVVNAP